MVYPEISDDMFYKKIEKLYNKFKISKNKQTLEQYCKPKKFELQIPQKFSADFINPRTPYKSLLIFHKIGAGKTCTAIQIAEKWKHIRKIIFVLPASLKGNLRDELRSLCGGNCYMKPQERAEIAKLDPSSVAYKKIIDATDIRIDKVYSIYSYNKFIEALKNKRLSAKNSVIIIDEIQNLISETGSSYKIVKNFLDKIPPETRLIFLSATPMFDSPSEISLTLNLMQIKTNLPTNKEFNEMFIEKKTSGNKYKYTAKNLDEFKKLVQGYVSYYGGAPSYTFPEVIIKYVKCEMSDFQYNIYNEILKRSSKQANKNLPIDVFDLPNNFYIGARFVSNVVFPNKKIGKVGFGSFSSLKIKNNLEKFSTKFLKLCRNLKRNKGKAFIFSSFKEYSGIKSICKVLDTFGFKNYAQHGVGKKRYAIWSGDEDIKYKNEIKAIFNGDDNVDGNILRIILGSPAIKEGVSLKAVRSVHVMEPHWNYSRLLQIIGRASRFCSHKDLAKDDRNVNVYIYIATKNNKITVDQYMKKIANVKQQIISQFEMALKEAAVDCRINKNAHLDEHIKCV